MEWLNYLTTELKKKVAESEDFAKNLFDSNEATDVNDSFEFSKNSESSFEDQLETLNFRSIEAVGLSNEKIYEKNRNFNLAENKHPVTDVPFVRQEIVLRDGTIKEGVFPVFKSYHDAILPKNLHLDTDHNQANYLNESLRRSIEENPKLKEPYNERQLEQIEAGYKPEGFTWHHHQETGRMQLVETAIHKNTGHIGGKEIWGGGRNRSNSNSKGINENE